MAPNDLSESFLRINLQNIGWQDTDPGAAS